MAAAADDERCMKAALAAALQGIEHGELPIGAVIVLDGDIEPCVGCFGAAMTVGVGRIVYALESPADGATRFATEWDRQRVHHELPGYRLPAVHGGVLRDESRQLFARFTDETHHNDGLVTWAQTLAQL